MSYSNNNKCRRESTDKCVKWSNTFQWMQSETAALMTINRAAHLPLTAAESVNAHCRSVAEETVATGAGGSGYRPRRTVACNLGCKD